MQPQRARSLWVLIALTIITGGCRHVGGEVERSARVVKLHSLAMEGNTQRISEALRNSREVEFASKDGRTLLMCAAGQGRAETVKLLLARGASVQAADGDGRTALLLAAGADPRVVSEKAGLQVVRQLLAAGASVTVRDVEGYSAADLAAAAGRTEVVAALKVERGR